jgi:hypothetical protein
VESLAFELAGGGVLTLAEATGVHWACLSLGIRPPSSLVQMVGVLPFAVLPGITTGLATIDELMGEVSSTISSHVSLIWAAAAASRGTWVLFVVARSSKFVIIGRACSVSPPGGRLSGSRSLAPRKVEFRTDEVVTASGAVVTERRLTAWQTADGPNGRIGGFRYSGKVTW